MSKKPKLNQTSIIVEEDDERELICVDYDLWTGNKSSGSWPLGLGLNDTINFLASKGDTTIDDNVELLLEVEVTESVCKAITSDELQPNDSLVEVTIIRPKNSSPFCFSRARSSFSSVGGQHSAGDVKEKTKEYYVRRFEKKLREFEEKITKMYLRRQGVYQQFESKRIVGERLFKSEPDSKPRNEGEAPKSIKAKSLPMSMTNQPSIKGFDKTVLKQLIRDKSHEKLNKFDTNNFIPNALDIQVNYLHNKNFNYSKPIWVAIRELQKYLIDLNERNEKRRRRAISDLKSKSKLKLRNIKRMVETRDSGKIKYSVSKGCVSKPRKINSPFSCQKHGLLPSSTLQSLSKNQTNVLICNIDKEYPVIIQPPTKTNNINKHIKVPDTSSRDLIAGECLTSIQKAIEYHLESMTSTEKLNRPELSNVGSLSPYDLGIKNTTGRSVLVNSCRSRSHEKLNDELLTTPTTMKNKTRLNSKELNSTVTSSHSISCTNLQSPNLFVRNLENNNDELLKEGYTNFNIKHNHLNAINKINKAHKENGVSSCEVSWEVSPGNRGFPTTTTSNNICGNELKYFIENKSSAAKNEMKLCAAINLTCKKAKDESESTVKESKRDSMTSTQDTPNIIIIKNYRRPEQCENLNNNKNVHFPLKDIKNTNISENLNNSTLADVIINKGVNTYCEGISELEECNMKKLTLLKHFKNDPSFSSRSASHQDHLEEEKVVLEKDSDFFLQTKNEEFLSNKNTQHYLSGKCPQSNNSRGQEIVTESIALKHLIKEINKKLSPSKDSNISSKNQIDTKSTNYVITDGKVIPTFILHQFNGSNNKLDFSRDSVCQTVISKQSEETSSLNSCNPIRKSTSTKCVHEEEDENCFIYYTQDYKGEPQQNKSVNNKVINKGQNITNPKKQFPNCGYSCEDKIQANVNSNLKNPHSISADSTNKKPKVTIYKIKKVELAPSMSDNAQDNELHDRKKYIYVESDKCVTEKVNTNKIELKPNVIVESFTNHYQDKAQAEKEKGKIKQRIHPETGTKESYFGEGCFAEVDNLWEEEQKQGFQNEDFNEGEYNKVINDSRRESNKIYLRKNINGKASPSINENNSKLKMFEIGSNNETRPSTNEESDYDPSQHCFESPSSISLYENNETFQEKLTKSNEKNNKSSTLERYICNEIQNCSSNKLYNNSLNKPTQNPVVGKVYKPRLSHQVLDDQSSMNKIIEKETWRDTIKCKNDHINPNESCAKSEPCYISSHFQNSTCYQMNDRAYTRSANNQNNLQDFEWDVSRKSVLHNTFLRTKNTQIKPNINDDTNFCSENRTQSDLPSEERHALVDDSQKLFQCSTDFSPEKSQPVFKTPQSLNESKQESSKKDNVFFWDGNKCATKSDAIKRVGKIFFDKLKQDHSQRTGACVSIPSPTVITTIPYDGVEEKISASLSNATKGFMDNEKLVRIINLKKYLQRPVLPDHTPLSSTISEKCSPINIPYSALNKFNNLKEEKNTSKQGRRLCHQDIVAISTPVALPQVEETLSNVPIRSTNSVEITYLSPWAHCWGTASEFEIPDKATNTKIPITETKQSPIDVEAKHNYGSKKLDEQNYSNKSCDVVCDEKLSTEESSLDANDHYQTYINNNNISQKYRLGDNPDKSKNISLDMTKKGSDSFGKKKPSHNQSELELTIEDFLTIIQGDKVRLNSTSSTNIAVSNSTRKWMLNEDILIKIKEILEIKAKDPPRSKTLHNK